MKQIFLVRHAAYEFTGGFDPGLSRVGLIQAEKLAKGIKRSLNGYAESTVILSSTAERARQTAHVIRDILFNPSVTYESKLWSDTQHQEDFQWLKEKIDSFTEDILIIVSHLEYVQRFPAYIGFRTNYAGYAEGVMISNNQCEHVPVDS